MYLSMLRKKIKVKFDNGQWYTGEVRSYLNGEHKVYYPYDQLTESQNFFFPDKPNFVGRGSWKLV